MTDSDPSVGETGTERDEAGVRCPFCDSTATTLEQHRGTALCRKLHYCEDCKQQFEQFG